MHSAETRTEQPRRKSAGDETYRLRRETEAAKSLIAALRETGDADDADIVETAIEGETNLHEAVGRVLDSIDLREAHIIGLKAKEQEFATRRAILEKRNETDRALVEQAMVSAEIESIPLPTATVFLTKRAPGLIVDNEADVPASFFSIPERPAPKLDRKALIAALRDGEAVPGAKLDNGSLTLSIRRK